jgi:hypothetical protein
MQTSVIDIHLGVKRNLKALTKSIVPHHQEDERPASIDAFEEAMKSPEPDQPPRSRPAFAITTAKYGSTTAPTIKIQRSAPSAMIPPTKQAVRRPML